jgi:hypothetical protein
MRYFTPELLAECRSSDPDAAEAAAQKWRRRAEAYRKRLEEISDCLPLGVRRLKRSVTLHDGYLLTINHARVRGRPQLFLSFQIPDRSGWAGVQLRYDLVKPLQVKLHDPNASEDTKLFALYDEFDVSADGTVTHSILLTGGLEIRVRFTNLHLTPFTQVGGQGLRRSDVKQHVVEMAPS